MILLSLPILCAFTLAAALPSLAEDGGLAGQIAKSETLMFGHPSDGISAQLRVETLETNIFGQPGSGPLNIRLKKINEALGLSGNSASSSQATSTTKPSAAGGVTGAGKTASTGVTISSSKNKTKAPAKLQAMTAKTDMPVVAPNRNAAPDPALPPVAPKAVMSPKQLLQLGAKRFSEGNNAEAESLFHQALVHDPNNVDALYNLGALAERRGDMPGALDFYRTALKLKPADADLKKAIDAVQTQIASGTRTAVSTDQNGPFHMPQQLGQPLVGGVFDNQQQTGQLFNGTPMQATLGQQPLVGTVVGQGQANVNQPPIGLANVTQPSIGVGNVTQPNQGKSGVKQALKLGVGVGLGRALPGPLGALHCPLCSLLNHF